MRFFKTRALVAGLVLVVACVAGCAGAPEERQPVPPPDQVPAQPGEPQEAQVPGAPAAPQPLLQNTGPVGAGSGGRGRDILDEIANEMGLQERAQRELAEYYYQQALAQYSDLQYREARDTLRQAIEADPNHEGAQQLLDHVLFILGEQPGRVRDAAREMVDRHRAEIDQSRMEIQRVFAEGLRHMDRREYDAAIERFERIQEIIRYFPFNLEVSDIEAQTAQKIEEARRLMEQQAIERQAHLLDAARQNADVERSRDLRYRAGRIRSLIEQGEQAYDRMQFDVARTHAEEVLREDPRNQEAASLLDRTVRAANRQVEIRAIEREVEEMRRTIEGVRESTIPYQDLFRWPDSDTWREISQRYSPPSRLRRTERSLVEQEILNTLETRTISVNFPGVTFEEAINFLQDITGLNYVLSTDARDEVESADPSITLHLTEVKLRNALELILAHVEGLTYKVRNGVILITTAEYDETELILQFYEVSDLTQPLPDNPAPELALDIGAGAQGGGGGFGGGSILSFGEEEQPATGGVEIDKLVDLMGGVVGEDVLDVGSIEPSGAMIIARLPADAHERIERLLESLRRTVGIMVTIEARFIDVQDNFLEEIGIDWRDAQNQAGNPFNIFNFNGTGGNQPSGYVYTTAQGEEQVRSALVNAFTNPTGTNAANPFNLTPTGGFAAQLNVLEEFQIEAILEAVKKTQRARLVNAPRVTVFNGQRSHVMAITQEAYISDVEVNQTGVTPVLNPVIGILNSGSILEARPIVSHDRRYVTLEIRPTLALNLTTDSDVANLNLSNGLTQIPIQLPVLAVQTLRTTVTIPDGGTVLLGGLKNFRGEELYAGVPVLSDIPILRSLFERHGWSDMKRSLVILVRADITIIREEEGRRFNFE